jgi:DNA-binding winged helix-turn-helix (wHTH) protein/Tol biopolymer transport system component
MNSLAFGPFRFDARDRLLTRSGAQVRLTPKTGDLLQALLESEGRIISKNELIQAVWPDTFVEDGSLTFQMHLLRQALRDPAENADYIQTVPRRGYRWMCPVVRLSSEPHVVGLSAVSESPVPASIESKPLPDAQPHHGRSRWMKWLTVTFILLLTGVVAALAANFGDPPPLRAARITQMTDDGIPKASLMMLDANRLLATSRTSQTEYRLDGPPTPRPSPTPQYLIRDVSLVRREALAMRPSDAGAERGLWVVPMDGATPRRLGMAESSGNAAWSHDALWIAYAYGNSIFITDPDGGRLRVVSTFTGQPSTIRWAADDRSLRVDVYFQSDRTATQTLYDVALDTRDAKPVLPPERKLSACCGSWIPRSDDYVFDVTSDQAAGIWAFRERSGGLWKRPPELRLLARSSPEIQFDSPLPSADGSRVFVIGTLKPQLSVFDEERRQFLPYLGGIDAFAVQSSPHRDVVAYIRHADHTLWRARADGSQPEQLTSRAWDVDALDWNPDGRRLAIRAKSPRALHTKIYVLSLEGGSLEPLDPRDVEQGSPTWSPDGTKIAFGDVPETYERLSGSEQIHIYDLVTHRLSDVPGSRGLWSSRWSPDGRYLAATRIVDQAVMLYTVATATWRELPLTRVDNLVWTRDSRFLYCDPESRSHITSRIRVSDGAVETVVDLKDQSIAHTGAGVSLDGRPLFLRNRTEIFTIQLERR